MPRRRRPAPAERGTRERLVDAAERLFGEHGIAAVSLRTINTAAGARNASAAHYHFRSRAGLLKAVLARRMDALSRARLARLDHVAAAAGPAPPDLHALVRAVIEPTVALLDDPSGGGARYVQFLARLAVEPQAPLAGWRTATFHEVSARFADLLQRALPEVPAQVLGMRLLFGLQLAIHAVAALARRSSDGTDPAFREQFAGHLVDYMAGGLSAPVSTVEVEQAASSRPAAGGRRGTRPATVRDDTTARVWGLPNPTDHFA